MRTFKFLLPIFFFATMLLSTTSHAQLIAMVDYMKVPEGGEAEYLKVEQEIWKPMHQEWVNQGKMAGWYLWSIPYPGGTNAEYHYATVRIYTDLKQIESPMSDMTDVFKKVHPTMDANKAFERTLASRDLVKTYGFSNWAGFHDTTQKEPSKYITVVYFKIPMAKWGAYQEMEKKYFHPTHKAEMEAGCRAGWEGWQLQRPFGTNQPFQFVAVDYYKDFSQFIKPKPEDLYKKALPEADLKKRDQVFYDTVEMVNLEEWRFVDGTAPKTETAEKK